jgi:predicted unusual protein kinase regulating ubiquinone biosynthesis (AarF/ABC1/UbiB family)
MASACQAELILLRVMPSREATSDEDQVDLDRAADDLRELAHEVAGARGSVRVVVDDDPAAAILDAVQLEKVDAVVVGNLGMAGRKQFLLSNIPNRISHNARCSVIIVNTDTGAGPADPITYRLGQSEVDREAVEARLLKRAWRIGRVLVKAGLRDLLNRKATDDASVRVSAQRIRAAMEELGPTFAKLGQILSTRPDLLPEAVIDELATLQEHVTPLTEAEVVAMMERELGVPWEDVFASIDPQPLAAGTIAQVHRATLESGERVVIKVQRPTAEQDIFQDLRLLEMFAEKAGSRPAFRKSFDIPAMIEHLSSSLRRELDFRREADNLKRMRQVLEPFPRLAVPEVLDDISTSRLLVMEEIQGVPVREAPPGKARTEAARQLLEAYYAQVMTEGFFHADPHPGNMKWWNDRIYFLDLGMVGELEPRVRELILLLLLSFAQEDPAFLAEIVFLLSGADDAGETETLEAFRADLSELISQYRKLSLKEIQLGPLFQEITRISVKNNIRVPASLALAGKAFSQMQPLTAELDPTLDPFAVAESFVLRRTARQVIDELSPRKVFYELQKAQLRLGQMVESLEQVAGARPGPGLRMNVRSDSLEASVRQIGNRLSIGFVAGGTLIGAAVLTQAERVPRWIPSLAGVVGSALTAALLADLKRPPR